MDTGQARTHTFAVFHASQTFRIKRSLGDPSILKACSAACEFDQEVPLLPLHLHKIFLRTLYAYETNYFVFVFFLSDNSVCF